MRAPRGKGRLPTVRSVAATPRALHVGPGSDPYPHRPPPTGPGACSTSPGAPLVHASGRRPRDLRTATRPVPPVLPPPAGGCSGGGPRSPKLSSSTERAHDPGDLPRQRLHQHHGRQLAAGEHVVADGDLLVHHQVHHALVDPLVAAAQQQQIVVCGQAPPGRPASCGDSRIRRGSPSADSSRTARIHGGAVITMPPPPP